MKIPGAELQVPARIFVWAGSVLFVASLAYFAYSYNVTFARAVDTGDVGGAIAWNVAVFSLFALHHSVFAREPVRAWMARTWGRLERSVYVWVASLLLALTCFVWRPVPGIVWDIDGPLAWLVRGLQVFGIWLALRGASVVGVFELAGIPRAKSEPDVEPEFKLVGPYAWVRHPIYLGWFLMVFAVPTMTMTQLVLAVVSCAYVVIAIPLEERSLRRTSGPAYQRYSKQVRWKLLPGVF